KTLGEHRALEHIERQECHLLRHVDDTAIGKPRPTLDEFVDCAAHRGRKFMNCPARKDRGDSSSLAPPFFSFYREQAIVQSSSPNSQEEVVLAVIGGIVEKNMLNHMRIVQHDRG